MAEGDGMLANAVEKRDAARRRWQELESVPWTRSRRSRAKREAAEELEFWAAKVAFLTQGRVQ